MIFSSIRSATTVSTRVLPVSANPPLARGPVRVGFSRFPGEYDIIQGDRLVTVTVCDKGSQDELSFVLSTGRARVACVEQVARDGSAQLSVHVFNGAVVEMGTVEVGLDEKALTAARRVFRVRDASIQELAALLNAKCVLDQGTGDEDTYFLFTTGPAADQEFETVNHGRTSERVGPVGTAERFATTGGDGDAAASVRPAVEILARERCFCIHGDGVRLAVARKRMTRDLEVFLASRLTGSLGHEPDAAVRLARGRLSFSDYTKTGQIRALAEGAMTQLLTSRASFLKKWDEYGEVEGEVLLARARRIGVLRYNKTEASRQGTVFFFDSPVSAELWEGDELEITREEPPYLKAPSMTWKTYSAMLEQAREGERTLGKRTRSSAEQLENKDASGTVAKVVRRSENSVTISLPMPPSGDGLFLVLAMNGDRVQIERRMKARRLIVEARSANPLLGMIIEEDGVLPETAKPPQIEALTSFVREKVFGRAPTLRQEEAIRIALNTPDIALIQGPPGTGKTTVIAAIVERLNELCDKKKSIRGEVLVTGFQHDAVENLMARLTVNSLPVPKFGRRRDLGEEAAADLTAERVRQWCDGIANQLHSRHPSLEMSERQRDLLLLCHQYWLSPSLGHAIHMIEAALQLPRTLLAAETVQRIQDLKELLEEENRLSSESSCDAIRAARGLRTSPEGFADDGPERAAEVLAVCERELSMEQKSILKQATCWRTADVPPFLEVLKRLKSDLLDRLVPRPVFRVDKARDEVVRLCTEVIDCLQQHARDGTAKSGAILASFLHAMENDPVGIQQAIADYSFVFAATCQQSQGRDILQEKQEAQAGQQVLTAYDTVIVDEAARTSPRDLLIPMAQARRRIILVGDHRQLPHVIDEEVARTLEAADAGSNESAADRENDFIKQSMFQYLFGRLEKLERQDGICRRVTLDQQFRMHPLLGSLVSDQFYRPYNEAFSSPLPAAQFTHDLPGTKGVPAIWLDVPNAKGREWMVGTSRRRTTEAKCIADLLRQWIDSPQGKGLSFGIISFYKAQVDEIFRELSSHGYTTHAQDGPWEVCEPYSFLPAKGGKLPEERLRIGTVDAFQGMEFDVVLLSMVRSCQYLPAPDMDLEARERQKRRLFGHLMSVNRLCVSMSRQKRLLVVVGDSGMVKGDLAQEAVPGLSGFYSLCQDKGVIL